MLCKTRALRAVWQLTYGVIISVLPMNIALYLVMDCVCVVVTGRKTGSKKRAVEQEPKVTTEDSDDTKSIPSGAESEENNLEVDEDFARSFREVQEETNASASKNGKSSDRKEVIVSPSAICVKWKS